MKKILKRVLAIMCAITMAVPVLSGIGPIKKVDAASNEIAHEWNIFTSASEEGDDIVNSSTGKVAKEIKPNIQLPECAQVKNDLQLYMEVYITNEDALVRMNDTYINVKNTSSQSPYYYWYFGSKASLSVGWNEVTLKFSNAGNYNPGEDPTVDFSQPIQYFRFYSGSKTNTTEAGTIRLRKMALKNPNIYLEFGGDDTHLQLSNQLASAPEVIEAGIKTPELPTEWLLRSGHNKSWYWYGIGNKTITYGTTTEEDAPGAGLNYAEPSEYPEGNFGFETTGFTAKIPGDYKPSDLEFTFWIWSSKASKMGGQIWMSSSGSVNSNYIAWQFAGDAYKDSDILNLNAGWNKITFSMDSYNGYSKGWKDDGIDFTSINWLRWHDWKLDEGVSYKVSDFKIVLKENTEEQETEFKGPEAILIPANGNLDQKFHDNSLTGTNGTVGEGENGPEVGTVYAETTIPAGGKFGFRNWGSWKTTQLMTEELKEYQEDELAISFWIYSETGEDLPSGGLTLASYGWHNANTRNWQSSEFEQLGRLNIGWNYIEIPLSQYSSSTDTFNYQDIQCVRLYTHDAAAAVLKAENTFRITDVKMIVKQEVLEELAKMRPVTTKEVTDATTLSGNQMIFSNTNVSGETPYALYVTSAGYPALLWGTTQYTLEENVCNNEWQTIKVVRNSEGYIEFYLNGVLKGKSEVVESDTLSTFTTAHRIAADGAGGQVFNGRIANLNVYSDTAATNCIGSWQLNGNIEHVLDTMLDASTNANHAVFRGTRASDWVTYDSVKTDAVEYVGEDYWSMIFVPDIQNLAQPYYGYDQTWYTMAQWIADNIDAENVKHVIGAGDNTWDNLDKEYVIAQAGFDKFKNMVSWSNMSGNHEYTWTAANRTSTKYNNYFGANYIAGTKAEETYMGSYNDPVGLSTTENSYYRFNVNGVNWMILQMEYYPRLSVLEWAKGIVNKYASDNVIITTHGYLSGSGGYCGDGKEYLKTGDVKADGSSDYLGSTTQKIWTELQSCTNIKMILCGHSTTGTGAVVQKNEINSVGDTVPALMINAQDLDLETNGNGSSYFSDQAFGMLSILRFSADGTKATVQLYCPQHKMSYDPIGNGGNRDSNKIQMSYQLEAVVKEYKNVTAGVAPTENIPEGYIFAGWYKDNTCLSPVTPGSTADKAFAKFVDKRILGVKVQAKLGYDSENDSYYLPSESTDIRFATTVDSSKYKRVGFKFLINGKESIKDSDTVYEKLYAVGTFSGEPETYRPYEKFSIQSIYFKAFTIMGIKATNYDTPIQVTPFWETLDGTVVYGDTETKTVDGALQVLAGGQ